MRFLKVYDCNSYMNVHDITDVNRQVLYYADVLVDRIACFASPSVRRELSDAG